jgi:hypothetical protein
MRARQLTLAIAAAGLIAAAVPATSSAGSPVAVCNEAENSFRGGCVITERPIPVRQRSCAASRCASATAMASASSTLPSTHGLVVCDDAGAGGGDPVPT